MKELIIEISIDELGLLEAETFGFKGKVCEEALRELLSSDFVIDKMNKKDDYYKSEEAVESLKTVTGGRL